jgi:hypothetical protein
MKVHLIKTPEYDSESFNEVYDFLCSFNGALEFVASEYEFDFSKFPYLKKFFPDFKFKYESDTKKINFDKNRGIPLSWTELFMLCDFYRETFNVSSNDFVVLLTVRRNALNWFSHCENKNAFVHTGDWEHYTNSNHKYTVAYQVVENVMQSLMKIDSITIPNVYVHIDSRGCMNDFCQNKEQIILKLRTADICPDCIEKIQEERIDQKIVNQVLEIFEGIRKELLFKQKFKKQIEPVSITINERRQILLPQLNNLEIRLNPLFKTLYIFYLKHREGVRLNELNAFKSELLSLYKKISVADNNQTIETRITDLVNPFGSSFSQKKSKLNKIITELLGEPLAKFYRIEGEPGEPFKINIPGNLIDIRY